MDNCADAPSLRPDHVVELLRKNARAKCTKDVRGTVCKSLRTWRCDTPVGLGAARAFLVPGALAIQVNVAERLRSRPDWPATSHLPARPPPTSIYALYCTFPIVVSPTVCCKMRDTATCCRSHAVLQQAELRSIYIAALHPGRFPFFSLQQACQFKSWFLVFILFSVFLSVNQGLVLFATTLLTH